MIIDYKNKLVFIANKKIGSTSIEAKLRPLPHTGFLAGHPQLKHTSFEAFAQMRDPMEIGDFKAFTIVRHPIDKFVSWFSYRSRKEIEGSSRYLGDKTLMEHIRSAHPDDFEECRDWKYVQREDDKIEILFKYEDFAELEKFLQHVYPECGDLGRENQSSRQVTVTEEERTALIDILGDAINWYESLESDTAESAIAKLS